MKRRKVLQELTATERSYVKSLSIIKDVFVAGLVDENKAPILAPPQMAAIFSNSEAILELHTRFLRQLEDRLREWGDGTGKDMIRDIFKSLLPLLKRYNVYATNFDSACDTLSSMQKKSPAFAQALKNCESKPECAMLNLGAFLLEPIQRIPRYKLLLQGESV